jgi:hypothetical protein
MPEKGILEVVHLDDPNWRQRRHPGPAQIHTCVLQSELEAHVPRGILQSVHVGTRGCYPPILELQDASERKILILARIALRLHSVECFRRLL